MTQNKRPEIILFVYSVAFFAYTLNALRMAIQAAPGGVLNIVLNALGLALSLALAITLIVRQYARVSPVRTDRAIRFILGLLLLAYWVSFVTHLPQLHGATEWILTLVLLIANSAFLIVEIRQHRA